MLGAVYLSILAFLLRLDPSSAAGREGLQLFFEDKFDQTPDLNESIWSYNYPWGSIYYHQANLIRRQVSTTDSNQVKITAIAARTSSIPTIETPDYGLISVNYTSGAIYTNQITLKQGLTIVNMRVPSAPSTWPMMMMVPLDEMIPMITMDVSNDRRNLGYAFRYTSAIGATESVSGTTRASTNTSLDFHSYAIDWGYDKVSFLYDNVLLRSFIKPNELKQVTDMSLVIALGVGGKSQVGLNGTADYPANLLIDNVQMWNPKYDGRFKIMNYKSRLFLEVEYGSIADAARVIQNSFKGTNWQHWDIQYVGYNTYKIINANSKKAMDDFDWQTNDGAKIVQYRYDTKDNQIWRIVDNEDQDGTVTLVNVWAQKAAAFVNGTTQAGAQVVLNEPNDGDDQKWVLIRMS